MNDWLSNVEVKPIQPMPETEGLQRVLAYLYSGTISRLTTVEPDTTKIQAVQQDGFSVGGAG